MDLLLWQLYGSFIMACRAIPVTAVHRYIYIYLFVSLMRVCVVYVVKEVDSS